jgi:glycosyltransferase involved in cell wall biosynthesis
MTHHSQRIGFISTRLAGTDGVSLEASKWADILTHLGHDCFYFAGECDQPSERSYTVPEAHFKHPIILQLTKDLFDDYVRSSETSDLVMELRGKLKSKLYEFVRQFDLSLLIVENALSIPMNVPLALAITELIAETSIPTIAHHHDFSWERKRFAVHAASDYLGAAFPPDLNSIHHVVINSYAAKQLASRKGISSTLIPNVMDFDHPPSKPDNYVKSFRKDLDIPPESHIVLQPTRIVPRKRIELAIELIRRLSSDCILVITHESGDEGTIYKTYLEDYAQILGVRVVLGTNRINHHRTQLSNGGKVFSLMDAYQMADLVSYPSTIEGFGNAFLETIYYKRPIVISTYEIFKTDIQPKGFRVIGFDDFITEDTVRMANYTLDHPDFAAEMAEENYKIGRRYYSYSVLQANLAALITQCTGAQFPHAR